MYSITDLRKGTVIQLDGTPYRVVEYAQKQMGRGGSIVNTKLKNLIDGAVTSKTFKGADKIEPAELSNQKVQFLYRDSDTLHFMNEQTYDQIEVNVDIVGDAVSLMKEGSSVEAQSFEGRVINVELPVKIPLEVVQAPDVVKGDTQSTVMKEVELETGAKLQTPIFIKAGDTVIVDTRDGTYVERAKE
ncbi:MAG: elongation factor P [Candidatus Saccharimonadales bacterium]|nr:elongation factor P [Candidatus Saccharimonadales bacterium]